MLNDQKFIIFSIDTTRVVNKNTDGITKNTNLASMSVLGPNMQTFDMFCTLIGSAPPLMRTLF